MSVGLVLSILRSPDLPLRLQRAVVPYIFADKEMS